MGQNTKITVKATAGRLFWMRGETTTVRVWKDADGAWVTSIDPSVKPGGVLAGCRCWSRERTRKLAIEIAEEQLAKLR